jgi:predicted DNA-binding transcriptional regulator AlpA
MWEQKVSAILRPQAAWTKLGIGRTTFYEKFVKTGRVKLVDISERAKGAIDSELDALIDELRAKRDGKIETSSRQSNKENAN